MNLSSLESRVCSLREPEAVAWNLPVRTGSVAVRACPVKMGHLPSNSPLFHKEDWGIPVILRKPHHRLDPR